MKNIRKNNTNEVHFNFPFHFYFVPQIFEAEIFLEIAAVNVGNKQIIKKNCN